MGRIFNFTVAIVMLLILLPFMIIISIAIRLESNGPAIFRQKRVGKENNYFILYKFRTMHINTPDLPSEMLSSNDPRFTRLGKILRRLSLDELPQLINIIKGNMNFIGPRPALYNQEKLISLRMEVGVNRLKPGVTGWAQVNGRDNITNERKVELDRYYMENQSLIIHIKIIYFTIVKSLLGLDLYAEKADSLVEQNNEYQSADK